MLIFSKSAHASGGRFPNASKKSPSATGAIETFWDSDEAGTEGSKGSARASVFGAWVKACSKGAIDTFPTPNVGEASDIEVVVSGPW